MLAPDNAKNEDFGEWFRPYYLTVVNVNGFFSLFLHLVVFYLQIFCTPREMRNYRLFLLNTSVSFKNVFI